MGKTTEEMQTLTTFSDAGWSISANGGEDTVWRIYDGQTYPLLRSFLTPLAITANDATKTYDGLAYSGGAGVTYEGFRENENQNDLLGTLSYGGSSQNAINAGEYAIVPSGYYSQQDGYDITFENGQLTVNQAPLTVTANDDIKTYNRLAYRGGNGITYSGFVNGETSSVLDGTLTYGGSSQGAVYAGTYSIVPSGLTSTNYAINYVNVTLTINATWQTPVPELPPVFDPPPTPEWPKSRER